MRRLLAGVIILAVPASAQNTNCQVYGSSVNCQTTQPPKGIDWGLATRNQFDAGEAMRNARQNQQQAYQNRQQQQADANSQQTRVTAQHAGELAAEGKCDEAKAFALRMGEFQIARDVASVCTK